MDPLTAFSLAAGILQFIDFTSKFIHKSYEVYKTGTLSDHVSIEAATLRLTSLTEWIRSSNQNDTGVADDSVARLALNKVVAECLDIAKQIDDALKKFKPKNNGQLESARVALRAMFKQKKLEELEERLSRCRQEMLVNFVVLIQADIGSIDQKLLVLGEQDQIGHRRTQDDLKAAVNQILIAIEKSKSGNPRNVDLNKVTRQLRQVSLSTAPEQAFLDNLYLPILEDRERQIVKAADETFHWIFDKENGIFSDKDTDTNSTDNSSTNSTDSSVDTDSNAKDDSLYSTIKHESTGFEDWLSMGKGVFWITGKPGCGKSTLMKYISQHPRAHAALQDWAGQSELVTAAAYFWISGDPRQRSLVGLWRSLFYKILSKHPYLIHSLFPWRWRRHEIVASFSEEFSEDELLRAMEKLPLVLDQGHRFCFFIDGLDEFQGDHQKLANFLHELSKNDNLKICVSSRPWDTFRASFANDPTIRVDDWTRTDIRKFARQQLDQHPIWTSLMANTPLKASALIADVSYYSSGVFLWVHLVVRELKTAMDEGDTIEEMTSRLRSIPPDLNDFFKRMLDNVPLQYRDQTKRYLAIATDGSGRHPLWMYFYAEDKRSNFGELATISPLSVPAALARFQSLKRRIENRCRDLLEIYNPVSADSSLPTSWKLTDWFWCRVTSTHRSVKDFLLSEGLEYTESLCYENHDELTHYTHSVLETWQLQSVLAEMKRLSSIEIERDDLSRIRYLLLLTMYAQHEPPLRYLEELKRVGELTMLGHEVEWPLSNSTRSRTKSFLNMAVAMRWCNYVKQKLLLHDEGLGVDQEAIGRLVSFLGSGNEVTESGLETMERGSVVHWGEPPSAKMAATLQACSQELYERRRDEFCWIIKSEPQPGFGFPFMAELIQKHRSGEQEVYMKYRWRLSVAINENFADWDGWDHR